MFVDIFRRSSSPVPHPVRGPRGNRTKKYIACEQQLTVMTCFWDGILTHLRPDERRHMGSDAAGLKEYFARQNRLASRCMWQGSMMRPQQLQEHVSWIRDDTTPVSQGHDTSTCDPYLCLLVDLLGVDVVHNYAGSPIHYMFARVNRDTPVRTLRFRSNHGHFWATR